jgi:hypothetical protein
MADRSPRPTQTEALLRCTRCGALIELCAFCERADCPSVICYRCLRQELRQSLAQPHAHDG